jgi:hypothetical protein
LRSEIDKASPLLLQCFDFSTLYTKIDIVDLKAHMRVLINKLFNWMLKRHRFKFLMVQQTAFKRLLKSSTCPVVLHRLSLVCRSVDDLFVPDFPDFVNFMYLKQDSIGSGIYPITSCELNCTSWNFFKNSSKVNYRVAY